MLLQLQHEHKPKKDTAVPSPSKIKPFSKSKLNTKEQPTVQPENQPINNFVSIQGSTFNFHIEGLEKIHKESFKQLSSSLIVGIIQRKKFREERIYEATVNTATEFIGVHLRDLKPKLKQGMQSMFEGIQNEVEAEIWNGKYRIQQSRYKQSSRENKDKKLVSLIANELITKKMNSFINLNEPDEEEQQRINVLVSSHAKTEIQKTKKAQEFVNKMRQMQAQRLEQLAKRLEQQKLKELNSIQQQKAARLFHKQQKKALIKRRMAKQGQFISLERQRTEKINNSFLKMIDSYKKPLYQEIQERYNKSVVKDQKKNFQLLQKIKDEKVLNFEQINYHKAKYTDLLQEQEDFRQQKRQLRESQQQAFASHRPRRSKFHSQILRDSPKIDQLQYKASLIRKQAGYADFVRQNFIPRIDSKKKQEIQQLIKRISKQDTNGNGRRHMSHGKQNLQMLHMMIEQLRGKNQLKPTFQLESINMPKEVSKRYKNYLEQLKSQDKNGKSQNYQSLVKKRDDDYIMLISKQKQAQAQQREKYLNSSIENIDIHQHMEGSNIVEENYIDATRAKMALLKKYQSENPSHQIQQEN